VEGRRDPDAAPSARGCPARTAEGFFAVDVAGPGVAGLARRDTAGRALGRVRLIVARATILRWHRGIVRRRWARLSRRGRSGRPPVRRHVRPVALRRLARENESWGYRRIHGELAGRGIIVAPSTVWQILKDAGTGPAPRRDGPGWGEFLRSPAQGILALDLFTAGLLNGTTVYVFCGDRARQPARPGPGRHAAPGPVLGRPASPEPAHGPGGCPDTSKICPA
jgi:transposase